MKRKRVFSILQAAGIAVLLLFALPVDAKMEKPDSVASVSKTPGHHEYEPPAEAIDLGLPSGTLWASYNIGATKPEEYGGYYSWGEIFEKDDYSWNNYSHLETYEKHDGYVTIICKDIGSSISGTQYDVARMKWGGDWRMPTKSEMEELLEYCIAEVTTLHDVQVMKFTGPSGKFIFFPFSGMYINDDGEFINAGHCTMCWSGDLDSYSSSWALAIYNSNNYNWVGGYSANAGFSIRPVKTSSTATVWHLYTDRGEKFLMSQVGMLVAIDESAYFSVLDINGNVLAEDVLRVHFVNTDPVGVKNITTEKSQNILKRYVDNQLTLVGVKGTIDVYSVNGMKVTTVHATGQETIINVSSLPSGVYIVKCGNQSFKFNKK